MNREIREELKRIQSELRQPFPPECHGIRELPGRGYWAFVPHHDYRERLDEVCPEWESSYSPIEQVAADVVCKCTITILGIRKEAIGSVPLVAAEKNGKDVSRGSAADRLAAEAFKNACEAWGVGRYLDDQGTVANYLNNHATKLDYETKNKLRPLGDYLRSRGELPPTNSNVVLPKLAAPGSVITEGQVKRLWAIAKPLPEDVTRSIVKNITGVDSNKDISLAKYDDVIKAIQSEVAIRNASQPEARGDLIPSETDRELLAQEINSLRKRKNLDAEAVKKIMIRVTGKEDGKQCSNLELLKVRDELALLPAM